MKNRQTTSSALFKLTGILVCLSLSICLCGCKDGATETSTTAASAQSATTASTSSTTASTEATTPTASSRSSSSNSSGTSSTSPTSGIPNLVTTSDDAGAGGPGGSDMGGGTADGDVASDSSADGAPGDGSAADALPDDSALDPSAADESLPSDASADSGSSSDIPSGEGDIPDLPLTDPSYIATQRSVEELCMAAVNNGWDVFYADRGFGTGDREHVYTMYVCAVISSGSDGQYHRVDCEIGGQPTVWWCTQVGGTSAEAIGSVAQLYNTTIDSVTNYLVSYGVRQGG
ncbi:MAG: hypothetical protein IK142_00630 [Clostridiales bacterium]|nr:hypothetical protein [Clostridiales bacterium]